MKTRVLTILRLFGTQVLPLLFSLMAIPAAHGAVPADDFQFRATWDGLVMNSEVMSVAMLRMLDSPMLILADSLTRVETRSGASLDLDQIPKGASVEIHAEFDADGLAAARIVVDDLEIVSAVGTVQAVSGNRFVVSGVEFALDDETAAGSAPLQVGQMVAVQGRIGAGGALVASQVDSTSYLKVIGKITDKKDADKTITVAGKTFYVTDKTQIRDSDHGKHSFSDLKVGQTVDVRALTKDGRSEAHEIRILAKDARVEIRGTIDSFNATSLTVLTDGALIKVTLDSKTVINGTLLAGAKVGVTAVVQSDGSLLATRVVVKGNEAHEGHIEGKIEKITGTSLVVGGITVQTDSKTQFKSKSGALKFSDLKVGDFVAVSGPRQSDGSILARVIEVGANNGDGDKNGHVEGKIEKINGTSLTVNGVIVRTDNQTQIKSKGRAIKFSDLKVGDSVAVSGPRQSDGAILARVIEVGEKGKNSDE